MKKLLAAAALLIAALAMGTFTYAEEAPPPDYIAQMTVAARQGDIAGGRLAESLRNAYIDERCLDEEKISFDDLYLLAKFIYYEAGSDWLTDEMRLCVGEVIINRARSPEYPNTIEKVIFQPGQFACAEDEQFVDCVPPYACIKAALRLLQGERMLEPQVIYCGSEPQGTIFATFCDRVLGYTYFCESSNKELYGALKAAAEGKETA